MDVYFDAIELPIKQISGPTSSVYSFFLHLTFWKLEKVYNASLKDIELLTARNVKHSRIHKLRMVMLLASTLELEGIMRILFS